VRRGRRDVAEDAAGAQRPKSRCPGRGYQWTVDLMTIVDEPIELLTTGRIEIAKTFAAGLAARFGFSPIAE